MFGCTTNNKQNVQIIEEECSTPYADIYIQPYGVSSSEIKQISKEFTQKLNEFYGCWNIHILPNKELPDSLLNEYQTRYSASKILQFQSNNFKHNTHKVIVGITKSDISAPRLGHKDYGIIGLAYSGKGNCIISLKRINKQSNYWKAVLHEFIHAYYGYPHCPEDNSNCIMQNAKGHANFNIKEGLCDYCKSQIQ